MRTERLFPSLFYTVLSCLCIFGLHKLDKFFLRQNDGFSINHIYGSVPYNEIWEVDHSCKISSEAFAMLCNQPFHYLNKGHQSFVFESADGRTVLKFYRFPSHMRRLAWLNPFNYYPLTGRRKKTHAYNRQKLDSTFLSFKAAFEEFPEESGLLALHLNRTRDLHAQVKIIDRLGLAYFISLDEVPFALQRKAELLFPALERRLLNGDLDAAKRIISNLVQFIAERSEKGYLDDDPVLERNYGLIDEKIIHIDTGRLIHENELSTSKQQIRKEVIRNMESLNNWLKQHSRELYYFYQDQIEHL